MSHFYIALDATPASQIRALLTCVCRMDFYKSLRGDERSLALFNAMTKAMVECHTYEDPSGKNG